MNWERIFQYGLAFVIGVALAPTGNNAYGHGMVDYFDLEIAMDKDVFLLSEPVWVDVQLSHVEKDTLVLPYRPLCLGCGTFDVLVTSGDRVFPYTGAVGLWIPTPQTVAPGEVISKSFDLISVYGEPLNGTRLMQMSLPVGRYDVSVHEFGVDSETVSFSVEEPSAYDAVIYQTMVDATLLKVRHLRSDAAARLEELLATVGDSPYREKLLFEIALVWLPNRAEHLNACRRIIDDDLDSPYARYAILRLMQTITTVEAEMLREYIDDRAPESRAAKAAAEALARGWVGTDMR